MKKFVVALTLALASSVALAESETGSENGSTSGAKAAPVARMQDELDLTDEQKQKMREIRDAGGTREEMQAVLTAEQQAKAAELRKERMGERADRMKEELGLSSEQMAKIKDIRKAGGTREEVRAVLTPEQQVKFDAMRSEHQGQRQKSEQ